MRFHFFVLTVLIAAVLLPGAVVAQENTTATPTPSGPEWSAEQNQSDGSGVSISVSTSSDSDSTNESEQEVRVIDQDTRIVEDEYDSDTGVFRIIIESDRSQAVSLTDSAPVWTGGSIAVRSARLQPGRNVVEVEATEVRGRAIVTVGTSDGAYSLVDRGGALISGPWSRSDVQVAGGAGAVSVAIIVLVIVLRAALGESHQPERIA